MKQSHQLPSSLSSPTVYFPPPSLTSYAPNEAREKHTHTHTSTHSTTTNPTTIGLFMFMFIMSVACCWLLCMGCRKAPPPSPCLPVYRALAIRASPVYLSVNSCLEIVGWMLFSGGRAGGGPRQPCLLNTPP